MYQLALALERLSGELGIQIRLNTEVDEILWKEKQAYALQLGDGETVRPMWLSPIWK